MCQCNYGKCRANRLCWLTRVQFTGELPRPALIFKARVPTDLEKSVPILVELCGILRVIQTFQTMWNTSENTYFSNQEDISALITFLSLANRKIIWSILECNLSCL